jgi:hypothetical protein
VHDVTPFEIDNEAELLKNVWDAKRLGATCIIFNPVPDALPPSKFLYQEVPIHAVIQQLETQK